MNAALLAAACLACIGCRAMRSSIDYPETPANNVGIFGKHYFLSVGYGDKEWLGTYDQRDDKSIISHLPTRSEFAFYLFAPADSNLSPREGMLAAVRRLKNYAGTTNATETWETGPYHIRKKESGRTIEETLQLDRLVAVFTGQRPGGAHFPRTDEARTECYVTCINCSRSRPGSRLYFVAAAVIPTNVPAKESADLLQYFRNVLAGLTLYE